jgi:hypothetical protein
MAGVASLSLAAIDIYELNRHVQQEQ